MDLENQKVLVAGLGKSGMAAYELLKNMGAKVSLFDGKKDLDVSGYDAPVFLGKMTKEELAGFACAVFSPGVPLDIDLASELRESLVRLNLLFSVKKELWQELPEQMVKQRQQRLLVRL